MRPDKDPEIIGISDEYRRCDACMDKYVNADDSICNDCKLNPIKSEEDKKAFIKDALENPTTFGVSKELLEKVKEAERTK